MVSCVSKYDRYLLHTLIHGRSVLMGLCSLCKKKKKYLQVEIPSSSMALQPGVGLGLLYNMPPSLSIPCSVPPFVYSDLSQVRGHVIQPSHFWSCSSSCCIQLSVQRLFWNCGVSHSFCMTKPLYSLTFYRFKYMCKIMCNTDFWAWLHNLWSYKIHSAD